MFVFPDEDAAFAAAQSRQLEVVRIPPVIAATAGDVKGMKLVERASVENRGIVFPIPKAGEKMHRVTRSVTISPLMLPSVKPSTMRLTANCCLSR